VKNWWPKLYFWTFQQLLTNVWHAGLLAKLNQAGIEGQFYTILESYLKNRKQKVLVDGPPSVELSVEAGVPQGSWLGPLLFILYKICTGALHLSSKEKFNLELGWSSIKSRWISLDFAYSKKYIHLKPDLL
jgi:hypothetical protein